MDRTAHTAPFDHDARKLAAPEDPEEGKTCGDCLFCKEAGGLLACVVEAYDAEDEDEMYDAEVHVVEATQGACDQWVDSES